MDPNEVSMIISGLADMGLKLSDLSTSYRQTLKFALIRVRPMLPPEESVETFRALDKMKPFIKQKQEENVKEK